MAGAVQIPASRGEKSALRWAQKKKHTLDGDITTLMPRPSTFLHPRLHLVSSQSAATGVEPLPPSIVTEGRRAALPLSLLLLLPHPPTPASVSLQSADHQYLLYLPPLQAQSRIPENLVSYVAEVSASSLPYFSLSLSPPSFPLPTPLSLFFSCISSERFNFVLLCTTAAATTTPLPRCSSLSLS